MVPLRVGMGLGFKRELTENSAPFLGSWFYGWKLRRDEDKEAELREGVAMV